MSQPPDTQSVLAGLKDFQRATVSYVFKRFYGSDPTRRFLVADEVGLGKTLVARGVIARTIDHLRDKPRIDVIYICSNADIARQNIQRLRIPGCADAAQATRLTLLPLKMDDLRRSRVNFVALTPATSFAQTAGGGRIDERVLLYWLLDSAWEIQSSIASLYVMQDYATIASFKRSVEAFDFSRVNPQIATAFVSSLTARVLEERTAGKPDLRARFEELRSIFCRSDARIPANGSKKRTQWIGELRRLLASVCLSSLEPDLIILDEFQRFKHLLDEESEAGELARDLFNSEAGQGARVLMLSATPYRGLSLHHETDDDHYGDFFALLRFLEDGDAAGCKEILAEYRAALPAVMTPDGLTRMRNAKLALQQRLQRVMARTERLASSTEGGSMLLDAPASEVALRAADVRGFMGAQRIADALDQGDVVEYWKSAPYLFNFMDKYALKRAFTEAPEQREMVRFVRESPETFLNVESVRAYKSVQSANSRLRELLARTVDRGMWRLLWMPPCLNYYAPSGPFADAELANVTKQLVFSAWHMVPRAVASLVSYEAERRMMRAAHPRAQMTQDDWKKQRGLLRFGISAGRLTGMPLLLLVYPCLTFARDYHPRDLARAEMLTADEARSEFAGRLRLAIEKLGIVEELGGAADERWYWLAPMLLDHTEFPLDSLSWWKRADLARVWAGVEAGEEDAGWSKHVEEAAKTLDDIAAGKEHLGAAPADLFEVLAVAASAAPATVALRTYARVSRGDPTLHPDLRDTAARTGRAFLTLFNHAEVIEAVRSAFRGEPYWQRVLEYAHAGGLQAVLDEYAHLLRESLGLAGAPAVDVAAQIGSELIAALTLRAASLRIDEIMAPPYAREVKLTTEPMRIRFAMRFGDDRSDEEVPPAFDGAPARTRKESVRAAFNSPFWPFVLISTTVGQEGLDFHHYCHSVTHWNLPSNPVDLEQREGRIHRYKGHAVRKNVAAAFAEEALRRIDPDVWETVFALGSANRPQDKNDLVPYWLFPGDAKIERHVPLLPFSRDVERLYGLRRALAMYRMVFGQSRQEDLITYLLAEIPDGERDGIVAELQIDLSPAIRITGEGVDAVVSLQLSGVDTDTIIATAAHEDNPGNRLRTVKQLLFEEIGVDPEGGVYCEYSFKWKATLRPAELRFSNVWETDDTMLQPSGDPWLVVIDFPFDRDGHIPQNDLERLAEFKAKHSKRGTRTLVWLPSFFSLETQRAVGKLTILDFLLTNDQRLKEYSPNLSSVERSEARTLLENQRTSLRDKVKRGLREAYGVQPAEPGMLDPAYELEPAQQFQCLEGSLPLRPPVAATLAAALNGILAQALEHEYPAHPDFREDEVKITDGLVKRALEEIRNALAAPELRVLISKDTRKLLRPLLEPLELAHVGDQWLLVERTWMDHFDRCEAQHQGPVTVRDLRNWIDRPRPKGLPLVLQNLIVSTYVLQSNRLLILQGITLEPGTGPVRDETLVEKQELPSQEMWAKAVDKAGKIFGVTGLPLASAQNMARLSQEVRKGASEYREPAEKYLAKLETILRGCGLIESNSARFQTALSVRAVLSALETAQKPIMVVRTLQTMATATSEKAMGTSLKQASSMLGALQNLNLLMFEGLRQLSDEPRATAARGLVEKLHEALCSDEYVISLGAVLPNLQNRATELIVARPPQPAQEPMAPRPPVTPEPPIELPPIPQTPTPKKRKVISQGAKTAKGMADCKAVLQEIAVSLDEGSELRLSWEIVREETE